MATVLTHSPRWTSGHIPVAAVEPAPGPVARPMLPPREAWPLLVTIVVTWMLMLATIAWYSIGA
jgi:hypothetical protein